MYRTKRDEKKVKLLAQLLIKEFILIVWYQAASMTLKEMKTHFWFYTNQKNNCMIF